MITLLHLSDLHFTTENAGTQFDEDQRIREALLADLGKDGRTQFDAILVSGDIAYHGYTEEYQRAKAWFEQVRTTTNSSLESVFVVPGNHDVNHTIVSKESSLWDLHQSLRRGMSPADRQHSLNKKLSDPFDFLRAMTEYRAFSTEYGCPTSAKELAWVSVLGEKHRLEDGTSIKLHGLNSALLSDGDDKKSNLLLGRVQFHHFNSDPGYVNIVLCHHPHPWFMDGNEANDFFRNQAQIVLCGHEHEARCYKEDSSLRVFAGAVHPNPREARWEPCYHVLRLSIEKLAQRELVVSVETRLWRDKDKCFGPSAQADGKLTQEERVGLPGRYAVATEASDSDAKPAKEGVAAEPKVGKTMAKPVDNDVYIAARRKLIVHFFRLGTIERYQVVIDAGVWEDGDDAYDGQERWARVFDRAERVKKLSDLWAAVAGKDKALAGQDNPFKK